MRDEMRCDETKIRRAWAKQYRRLYRLLDQDPRSAIVEADRLRPTAVLDEANIATLRACVYVDAGSAIRSPQVVRKASRIFRRLLLNEPDRAEGLYNFANSLLALAPLISYEVRPWHLATSGLRRVARNYFERAAESSDGALASQARTNQGNLLNYSYRWIEAYDCYEIALSDDPENGVAALRMAQSLLRYVEMGLDPTGQYRGLAAFYLLQAERFSEKTLQNGGQRAVDLVKRLLDTDGIRDAQPVSRSELVDDYLQFAIRNRLLLSPDIACCDEPARRCDALLIDSVIEPIDTPFGVPPVFAMFNQLKSDFAAARWLAFVARTDLAPETGAYSDTLDYAKYGVSQSLLLLAQRAAMDILDRVAVAASEYFGLPGDPASIKFLTRWHEASRRPGSRPLRWLKEVSELIQAGNTALIALAEVAEDLMTGGFLKPKRTLRHTATHRFVVQHDMGSTPSRDTPLIAHYSEDDFVRAALASLRTARAVIFYLRDAIAIDTSRKLREAEGPLGQLEIYPHHFIRGEDEVPGWPE